VTDYFSVIRAKTGIREGGAPSVASCSSQRQALDPRFRGGDVISSEQSWVSFEEQALPATPMRGYWQSVFYRLRHDPVTLGFAAIVLLIVLAAIFSPFIAPFDPYKESIGGRLKPFG
jgi:N-terminal TM domain of oligopeptide transport permease C